MANTELVPIKAGSVKGVEALISEAGQTHVRTPRGDRGVVVLLDFGREVFGNVEIGIAGSGSGYIDLGYSEVLEDGRVKPNREGVKYTDRVTLKKGRLEWQGFEPRAFRYMQMEFRRCSKPVAIDYVRVNQTTYPVRNTGSFECSDGLLNQIWKIGAYTTQLCMEDTFIDCPWRERAQWWGDARVESRVAYYAFNDTKLLAQGLRQIASTQDRSGAIYGMYPADEQKLVPDFSLFWVFSILDYYAFADDAGLVRDLYPTVRRLMKWFAGFAGEDDLLSNVPGWLFIDWMDLEKRGEMTALNCLYYQALRVASVIASIAGSQEDAENYVETSDRLRIAINKHLYSPRRGLYAECRADGKMVENFSRQTNILAALFDVADQYQRSTILRQLLTTESLPELTTPYFGSHLLEALYAGDRHAEALDIIRKKWGAMVQAGATTFWEHFTQDGSLCHGWSACPTRDLIAEYVGIKPVLGSHRFSVAPHAGDLKWAKGTIETDAGPLSAEWRIVRSALVITVDVPQGLKVGVYPPGPPDTIIGVDGKQSPARFVTVSAGTHTVRVTAPRPPKPIVYDQSLKPAEIPHVEILPDIYTRGGRRSELGGLRRRSRGGRSEKQEKPAKTTEVETVKAAETAETAAPEPVAEELHAAPTEEAAAEAPAEHKPRRGGRRRSRSARAPKATAPEQAAEEPTTPQPEAVAEPVPEAATEPAHPAEEAQPASQEEPQRRRRPSRRGGRRRSKAAQSQDQAPTEQPAQDSAAPEPAAPAPAASPELTVPEPAEQPQAQDQDHEQLAPRPARRRRSYSRRGGRRRRSSPDATEGSAPEWPQADTGPAQAE